MKKEKWNQIFREITDPFAKCLVENSERPEIDLTTFKEEKE